jgi:hypothetical protein
MIYKCKCGHSFPEDLGKYGCFNCEGDNPVKLIKMTIKEIKRELRITDADIAEMFGYKNAVSYSNSARKHHIEHGIISLYMKINNL